MGWKNSWKEVPKGRIYSKPLTWNHFTHYSTSPLLKTSLRIFSSNTFIFLLSHVIFTVAPQQHTRLHICTKKMYKDHLLSVLIMSWWNKYALVYKFMNFYLWALVSKHFLYFFASFFAVTLRTMWRTTKNLYFNRGRYRWFFFKFKFSTK